MISKDEITSTLYGAAVMIAFAALWAYAGLVQISAQLAVFALVIGVALLAPIAMELRKARRVSVAVGPVRGRRQFWIVVAIEILLIEVAVNVAVDLGHRNLLFPIIAIIVGLHFLPLASILKAPLFRATGAALTVGGAAMLIVAQHTDVSVVTAVGAAIILLTTACLRFQTAREMRKRNVGT